MPNEEIELENTDLQAWLESFYNDFLNSAKQFEKENVCNTIVFFGSSKICSYKQAYFNLKKTQKALEALKKPSQKDWEMLQEANNLLYMSRYYHAADKLAFRLASWSKKMEPKNQYLICTGGGPGIMEAANKGAKRAGLRSIGLGIDLIKEQGKNPYISPELKFHFNNFLIRKFWFFYFVKALIVFPGGMGTLDELAEILTLIQTKKINRYLPVVLYGSEYWDSILNFEPMARYNTIERKDLFHVFKSNDVGKAYRYVIKELEAHFV